MRFSGYNIFQIHAWNTQAHRCLIAAGVILVILRSDVTVSGVIICWVWCVTVVLTCTVWGCSAAEVVHTAGTSPAWGRAETDAQTAAGPGWWSCGRPSSWWCPEETLRHKHTPYQTCVSTGESGWINRVDFIWKLLAFLVQKSLVF